MFYRLIASGLFAGAITGFIVALLQFYFVQPILALGEFYEQATFVLSQGLQSSIPDVRIQGFKPIEHIDIVRDGLSIVFNLFIYMGYGLILVSIIAFNEYKAIALKNARSGLIWGMAVFIALYLAPGFLMPPQVPGIQSIDVEIRQFYWFSIVISTSIA
ncbi:MAG: CbtA family protein, partial [Pseudomonadota bacterium]